MPQTLSSLDLQSAHLPRPAGKWGAWHGQPTAPNMAPAFLTVKAAIGCRVLREYAGKPRHKGPLCCSAHLSILHLR